MASRSCTKEEKRSERRQGWQKGENGEEEESSDPAGSRWALDRESGDRELDVQSVLGQVYGEEWP